jgi:hypothetical protein
MALICPSIMALGANDVYACFGIFDCDFSQQFNVWSF